MNEKDRASGSAGVHAPRPLLRIEYVKRTRGDYAVYRCYVVGEPDYIGDAIYHTQAVRPGVPQRWAARLPSGELIGQPWCSDGSRYRSRCGAAVALSHAFQRNQSAEGGAS